MQRAGGRLAAETAPRARSSGLREGAAGTSVLSSLGMLRSKHVRPRGASRRVRAIEYPALFTKIETQAHTFQSATSGRVAGLWTTAVNSTTIRSQRSSRQGAGTQDIGFVRFLTEGQDFRHSIAREPSEAGAAGPDLAPSCHPNRALICRTRAHAPEPGTTSIQPQACTNFATSSTSTRLDSHVASNCRFGKTGSPRPLETPSWANASPGSIA